MKIITRYEDSKKLLLKNPKVWLITGVAGFIGSNLLEELLRLNQTVIGIDNFATGFQKNLDQVKSEFDNEKWSRFTFHEGDICNMDDCKKVLKGVDYVLHQAALGSVPRSIENPIATNKNNVSGFLNMLVASKEEGVESFTYAASSAAYGDHPDLPKVEENIGNQLSPYAVSKYINELYAGAFHKVYGFSSIGLRYFNVFGKRQDPCGAYAAVIPKWINSFINKKEIYINGDGETSRDFCYIENAVQMNILAATAKDGVKNEIYNVSYGKRTSLNDLFNLIKKSLSDIGVDTSSVNPLYRDFRNGDVRHSLANINKSMLNLGYEPKYDVNLGIKLTVPTYLNINEL